MKSRTPITIALVLGSAVLVYVAYTYVFKPAAAPSGTLTQSGSVSSATQGEQNAFLNIIVNLRTLELDGSLFSNPAFQSLKDSGVPLGTQPKGRPNPFAPLGVGAAASAQSQAAAVAAPSQ